MTAEKMERCAHPKGCTHSRGAHVEKRGLMPAHCTKCKAPQHPTHLFQEAVVK